MVFPIANFSNFNFKSRFDFDSFIKFLQGWKYGLAIKHMVCMYEVLGSMPSSIGNNFLFTVFAKDCTIFMIFIVEKVREIEKLPLGIHWDSESRKEQDGILTSSFSNPSCCLNANNHNHLPCCSQISR